MMPRAANNGTLKAKAKIGKKEFGVRGEDNVFVIKGWELVATRFS